MGQPQGGTGAKLPVALPVIFTQAARLEVIDAQDWYEAQASGLGVRFRVELDLAVQRISDTPALPPAPRTETAKNPGRQAPVSSRVWKHQAEAARQGRQEKLELFQTIRRMQATGLKVSQIAKHLGINRRRIDKWVRLNTLPERSRMQPRPPEAMQAEAPQLEATPSPAARQISPQVAAALLSKIRAELTLKQGEIVDTLKRQCPGFAAMRELDLGFRTILRVGKLATLQSWMERAQKTGIHALDRFVRTLKQDLTAVEAAVTEPWSNGPVEGQINRLKTLKRQMYGRAASHMIASGLVEEGLDVVGTSAARYDGRVRNPFDQYECGHWYARALSSYALLQAFSGTRYDAVSKTLYLKPVLPGDFRSFLSTGTGFGTVDVKNGKPFLEVTSGTIPYEKIEFLAAQRSSPQKDV